MRIYILSLFPSMFDGFLNTSIIKRAIDASLVEVHIHDFREYSLNKHKKVDDYHYGGGQGMVLACEPIVDCLKDVVSDESFVILMSPQGQTLKQSLSVELSCYKHLVIICGHYEGFDERIRDYVDMELSIGDYVLTGGELSSMVVCDSIIRLIDGSIREESHEDDSFSHGLLEYPQYTRPFEYDGNEVPEVLLSGHHENIRKWRLKQSLLKTYRKRPDLLENREFTQEEIEILEEIKNNDINVKVLILTVHNEVEYLLKAVDIGVDGYILKDSESAELKKAIFSIYNGESYIQASLIPSLNYRLANRDLNKEKIDSLTKRELEVLIQVANGMFNKEIAIILNISERTVKNHISNIFKKIEVNDRTQAAVFAIKNNLIKLYWYIVW